MDRLCYLPFEQQGPEVFHPLDFCVNRKELSCCAFCEATKCDDTDDTHVSVSDRNWENLLHMLEKKFLKKIVLQYHKNLYSNRCKVRRICCQLTIAYSCPRTISSCTGWKVTFERITFEQIFALGRT